MPATYQSMVCTKGIAAKLTNFYSSDIVSVSLKGDSVLVVDYSGNTRLIPKNRFIFEFVQNRKRSSESLLAIQKEDHPYTFEVSSGSGNGHYQVTLTKYGLVCNCTDYKNQLSAFDGDGACKHIYQTLTQIGYENVKEYREAWAKPGATLEKIIRQKAASALQNRELQAV